VKQVERPTKGEGEVGAEVDEVEDEIDVGVE
jgi:hypothetical protein